MIKKLLLLSVIASVTACQSYSEKSQCDPEKNYIVSNPSAMEEYKKLKATGEIKSYYSEVNPSIPCLNSKCVKYNPDNFSFIEKKFSDNQRKGIYTISITKELQDKKCIAKNPVSAERDYCFKVERNKNDEIKSRYKFLIDNTNKDVTIIKFIDLRTDMVLYEYSYQTYVTGSIGASGGGTCRPNKINNPQYKFSPIFFPTDK